MLNLAISHKGLHREFFNVVHQHQAMVPSSSSPGTVLCGVEQIVKEATNHLLANFIIHSQDKVIRGRRSTLSLKYLLLTNPSRLVSSILVTGRPGVGKTSIAREIAKRLEEDTRTYTC